MQTQVTVSFVNPPKKEGWSGSIKTKAGDYFSVKEKDLGLFEQGKSYAINYIETSKEGRIFKNFVSMADEPAVSVGPGKPPAPPPIPPYDARLGHNGHAAMDKDRLIFLTGVIGRAMGSGKFGLADVEHLAVEAVKAWDVISG